MSALLLDVTSSVLCQHGAPARATVPNPRVTVGGQPTVCQTGPWTISGCLNPAPPTNTGPCLTAVWVTGSIRVTSQGQPLLLQTSSAVCVPTATPLQVVQTQTRVQAT